MTLLCLRFWEKVDHSGGPAACWPWTASRNADGYGQIKVGGRRELAHRVGWVLVNGPIPPGMKVLHACDTPPCCNPADWFLGSIADNNADMVAKGRARYVSRRGEQNGRAKLTEADVHEIRLHGNLNPSATARRFGVDPSTVSNILARRTWA